jgi:hypothetical protein
MRSNESSSVPEPAEADGWFTVGRAAQLLGVPVPRIFDQIRDGRLKVRFEPDRAGEGERPLVTSGELALKSGKRVVEPVAAPAAPPKVAAPSPAAPAAAAKKNGESASRATPPPAATTAAAASLAPVAPAVALAAPPTPGVVVDSAALEESRRTVARLERELRDSRETLETAERKIDASLQAIYDRDVKIARLEAEVGAHSKVREEGETFVRHLEARLDKTEERSQEKEREIRRLAVGLGEAHSELRLLKPPAPEPPPAWKRRLAFATTLLGGAIGAALFGWTSYALASKQLLREAGGAAAAGVVAAFVAGLILEKLRRAR